MNKTVLILGATGNFGSKIAKGLVQRNIDLVIAGRRKQALTALSKKLKTLNPNITIDIAAFDLHTELSEQLSYFKPLVVINTCGPFQLMDYSIALTCIQAKIHYIDLADGRDFVANFSQQLNLPAKQHHCLAISGASTVPCLSFAVLAHYQPQFESIDSIKYGITPGLDTERGLATVESVLTYVGKPLNSIVGVNQTAYGWQNIYRQAYPMLGKRWMANCDIPDLDLFPSHFNLKKMQFSAGIESHVLHLMLWALSWPIRWGLPINLRNHAKPLLKISQFFNRFGSKDGGMHMIISGQNNKGLQQTVDWFIVAKSGHGLHIPTIPSILLAEKLINQTLNLTGAMPCIGLLTLEDYLNALNHLDIQTFSKTYQSDKTEH